MATVVARERANACARERANARDLDRGIHRTGLFRLLDGMRRRRDISAANARDNYRAAAAVRRSSRLFDRDTLRTDTPSPSAAIDRGIRNRIDRLRTSRRIDTSRRLVVDPTLSTPPRARRTARRGVPSRISRARLFPLPRPPPRISVASSRAFFFGEGGEGLARWMNVT